MEKKQYPCIRPHIWRRWPELIHIHETKPESRSCCAAAAARPSAAKHPLTPASTPLAGLVETKARGAGRQIIFLKVSELQYLNIYIYINV